MTTKTYKRISVLEEQLQKAGVAPEVVAEIMRGGEAIGEKMPNAAKADWMRDAMRRMDRLLDRDTRYAVRQGCACCLGGKRLKLAKEVAAKGGSLQERVKNANEAKLVFGHSVTLEEDGTVLVRFGPDGPPAYRCPCLPQATEPLSITYCYCCGGHVKHHLQVALGRKLAVKVRSSVLSSGQKKPCVFSFTVLE